MRYLIYTKNDLFVGEERKKDLKRKVAEKIRSESGEKKKIKMISSITS